MAQWRVVVTEHGGPEVLVVMPQPTPEPEPGQVRIRVEAASIGVDDVLMRMGVHPRRIKPPFTPGWDAIGIVDELGSGVRNVKRGERVAALCGIGGNATHVCVSARDLVRVPRNVDAADVTALPVDYVAAWQMLHRIGRAREGSRVLLHEASRGVRSAVLDLAALLEIRLAVTTRGPHELREVEEAGGIPIDREQIDPFDGAMEVFPEGCDLVLDGGGLPTMHLSYSVLDKGGLVIPFDLARPLTESERSGPPVRIASAWRSVRAFGLDIVPDGRHVTRYGLLGSKKRRPGFYLEDLSRLIELLSLRRIHPDVRHRFTLSDVPKGHELLADPTVRGRLAMESMTY
jgi:NADPH:quinone reductase-like Zn-dependent oxidoreductase